MKMKKILALIALILALVLTLNLCACGAGTGDTDTESNTDPAAPTDTTEVDPNTIDDTMTSEDGTYKLGFVTDVGQLKDKSFNEGTWNGVKLYAAANDLSYKYYQPANGNEATDDDRYEIGRASCRERV